MDNRAYLGTLDAAQKADLTRKADGPGLWRLAGHGGLILGLGVLIALGVPFWWALLVPQGVLIVFLFTLQHEATHQTPFANEALNEWVGWIIGVILVQPFLWFRYFHFAHHRHTNIPGKDPELSAPKPETWPAFLWHLGTLGYWAGKVQVLWDNGFGAMEAAYLPRAARSRLRREARGMLAIYAVAAASLWVWDVLLWVWLVPILMGFPVLRLYLLAEHGRCPYVADMFLNTRTTLSNRVVRFFAWNMPYHTDHHAYPQVPFHRLPVFHRMIEDRLGVRAAGYRAFTRAYVQALGDQD